MKLEFKRWFWGIIILILALGVLSSMIAMFSMIDLLPSFRIVFGSVYVLFLPGFIISYIFFFETKKSESKNKKGIDWIERIALSFGLSIAVVPITVFYLNLIGLSINLINSFLTILGITIISSMLLFYRFKKKKKK